MKKNYVKLASTIFIVFSFYFMSSQCVTPATPTITSIGNCGAFPFTSTLTTTGSSTLQTFWCTNSFGGNALGTGSVYTTPSLTASTVYYAAHLAATSTASLSLPAQSSVFSGISRGYYFTAPTSFIISGVRVPTDASTGNSNIAIVKFQGGITPPLFGSTTNSFDVLYLTQNNTSGTGTISVNIPVYSGDVIGVLGDRAGANSYAPAPSSQTLGSFSVTLTRMGMQFALATNTPQSLFSEAASSLSRVELYTTLGCLNSLTAYTVNNLPSPTVTAVSSNSSICNGATSTLTASGANTYSWSSGVTTANTVVSPTTTAVYTVVGTSTNGCTNSATVNLSVNPLPTLAIAGSTALCSGSTLTLTASGANTYSWNTSATTASISVSPTANITYTATGTTTAGCSATAIKSITVNSLPTVSVNSGAICSGNSFTIVPSGASTYTISGGSSVVTPTSNASYNVIGTSSLGCVSSNTAVSSITVNALPTVSVNSGAICMGNSFTIVPTGASTYTISGGSSVVTPTSNASYNVTGTSSLGCVSSNTAVSSVTVNALPTVSAISNSSLLCVGQTASLTASGATTYTWNTSANTSVIAISPSVTATYTVNGTNANGCSNVTTITQSVSACTGLDNLSSNIPNLVQIYPNPSNGVYTIEVPSSMKITIVDVLGKIVYNQQLHDGKYSINLSSLNNGIYILKAESNGALNTIRLIKE